MPRIAIVAALEREVRPLLNGRRLREQEHDGRRFRFFENEKVIVVAGGIGAAAARRASEAVIAVYDPQVVCSAGFAGALDRSLKVGDVIHPAIVINASDGSRSAINGGEGILVSFGSVAGPDQKSKLRESFGAQCVDMEAAAVARSAEVRGKQFTAVKAISDEWDFEFPAMDRFIDGEGKFSEGRFAFYVGLRPWLWIPVMRLALNGRRASLALCQFLRTEILRSA